MWLISGKIVTQNCIAGLFKLHIAHYVWQLKDDIMLVSMVSVCVRVFEQNSKKPFVHICMLNIFDIHKVLDKVFFLILVNA